MDGLLLMVYLHGFKGNDHTFSDFPQRVQHNLTLSHPSIDIKCIVYPAYETRGELIAAVNKHVEWLITTLAQYKAEYADKGGKGPVRVILLGHSMGGLVIADSVLSTLSSSALPILGVIGFDTPYLGLHPAVFKNTVDTAMSYASQGQAALAALGVGYNFFKKKGTTPPASGTSTPAATAAGPSASSKSVAQTSSGNGDKKDGARSSWWSLQTAAALAAGAGAIGAAGSAYLYREAITNQVGWATSHLSFVGELWKPDELQRRINKLVAAKGVGFHCFYTLIPPKDKFPARTFCVLPLDPSVRACFSENRNSRAANEIVAHIDMFTEKSDGLYELSQRTCALVAEWIEEAKQGRMGVEAKVQAGEDMTRMDAEKQQQSTQA